MVRFYSSGAPRWWPFHVVVPHRVYNASFVILDNGMWSFWKQQQRPPVDLWLAKIARIALRIEAREIIIILPDWLGDPRFTISASKHPVARRLCRDYRCMSVAHTHNGLMGFYYSALELASLDHVSCIAAPLKLPCRRGRRRLPSQSCQASIAGQVLRASREQGLKCVHGLGALLRPSHLLDLYKLGLASFDSTSWTRPNATVLRRFHPYSAKNQRQKDLFFSIVVKRLLEVGVPLELPSREEFLESLEVVL